MPIKARIDMLTTGVRTPVGIKVYGSDLAEIERVGSQVEAALRDVPGTRSTFAERTAGGYVDEAKRAVAAAVKLPSGYALEWSGQYENMQRVTVKRVAAPMVGGVATSFALELLVYPAVYLLWRWHTEVRQAAAAVPGA